VPIKQQSQCAVVD